MSEREARDLLGLPKNGRLDKGSIDTQFLKVFRAQQAKLNSICNAAERKKEWEIQVLIKEAHKVCLSNIGNTPAPTAAKNPASAKSAVAPATAKWTGKPHTASTPKRPRHVSNGSVATAGKKLGEVFVHLWLAIKNLIGFIVSVPAACVEVKDFISDILDQIKVVGIPKFVVVLLLIVGLMPIMSGCAHVVHQVAMSFVPIIDGLTRFFHNVAALFK